MKLTELKQKYDEFVPTIDKEKPLWEQKRKWFAEHIVITPYIPFEIKAGMALQVVDSVLSFNKETDCLEYTILEKDVLLSVAMVNMYTDIEYDIKEEDESSSLDVYNIIAEMGLDDYLKYQSDCFDAETFCGWVEEECRIRLKAYNGTGAVLNRRLKGIEDQIVSAVDKLSNLNLNPEIMSEVAETIERINLTVGEVKSLNN